MIINDTASGNPSFVDQSRPSRLGERFVITNGGIALDPMKFNFPPSSSYFPSGEKYPFAFSLGIRRRM
jgi:hypothetical protein